MRMMMLTLVVSFVLAGLGCDKGGGGTVITPADTNAGDTECTPDCAGKQCGDDGCGDVCGECQGNDTCTLGVCSSAAPICGNEICEPPEGPEDCPEDCAGMDDCGDDVCTPPETPETCPTDCTPEDDCGDNICTPPESPLTCPQDCKEEPECGDDACTPPETLETCPADCTDDPECGDLVCTPPENSETCPGDCPEDPECGDLVCTPPENPESCPGDCGVGPPACTEDADCEGPACPMEATKGCACLVGPDGGVCMPACDTDADCPSPPDFPMECGPDGVCMGGGGDAECGDQLCTPPETPETCPGDCGGPQACTDDADCAGPACPLEATKGCVCAIGPGGGVCMHACETDADCPSPPDFTLECGPDSYCIGGGVMNDCGDLLCTPPETPETCPGDCGGGPGSCEGDADCAAPNCQPEAMMGCICIGNPGGGFCVPACSTDNDCSLLQGGPFVCTEGFCSPEGIGPGGCETDEDCTQSCPPEFTKGCICAAAEPGQFDCLPACDTDSDCPVIGGNALECAPEGYCAK